jgi:hypothetical protein
MRAALQLRTYVSPSRSAPPIFAIAAALVALIVVAYLAGRPVIASTRGAGRTIRR